jgi:hypothetical protein
MALPFSSGCGGATEAKDGGSSSEQASVSAKEPAAPAPTDISTPEGSIQEFFRLANEGEYSQAENFMAQELKNSYSNAQDFIMGGSKTIKSLLDSITIKGKLASLKRFNIKKRGEGATVEFIVFYKNIKPISYGTQYLEGGENDFGRRDYKFEMIKRNNKWLIINFEEGSLEASDEPETFLIQSDLELLFTNYSKYYKDNNMKVGDPVPSIDEIVKLTNMPTKPEPPNGGSYNAPKKVFEGKQNLMNPDLFPTFTGGTIENKRVHPLHLKIVNEVIATVGPDIELETAWIQIELDRLFTGYLKYYRSNNMKVGDPIPSIDDIVKLTSMPTKPEPPNGGSYNAPKKVFEGKQDLANPDVFPTFPGGTIENKRVHPIYLQTVTGEKNPADKARENLADKARENLMTHR